MRARRIAAYLFDLALVASPWAGFAGLEIVPARHASWGIVFGLGGTCVAASVALLLVQLSLFSLRGRSLGMALARLDRAGGSRALALAVSGACVTLPFMVVALEPALFSDLGLPEERLPFVAAGLGILLELAFCLGREGRTLSDRLSGLRMEVRRSPPSPNFRDPPIELLDVLLVALVGSPMLLVPFDSATFLGAAVGSVVPSSLLLITEVLVRRRYGVTLAKLATARA